MKTPGDRHGVPPGRAGGARRIWYLRARRRRRGRVARWGLLAAAALACGAAAYWFLRPPGPESFAPAPDVVESELPVLRTCRLYFGDPHGGLQSEIRYLPREEGLEAGIAGTLEAFLEGSLEGGLAPWPRETTLLDLFISRSGIAYLNLSGSLRYLARESDWAEWCLAAALTRTLCENHPELQGVRLMVDGDSRGALVRLIPLEWTLTPAMFRTGAPHEAREATW